VTAASTASPAAAGSGIRPGPPAVAARVRFERDGTTGPALATGYVGGRGERERELVLSDGALARFSAGAETGHLVPLLRRGARVAAGDVPSPRIWQRILGAAHDGTGTLSVPVRSAGADLEDAGVDLLAETPEISDVLLPQQGPNYTLAERIQRWRAVVAQTEGVQVSANVARATRTRPVTKNRLLAAAHERLWRIPYAPRSVLGLDAVHRPPCGRRAMT
jgi:hypothetical protein